MITQDFNREFILSQLLDLSELPILLTTEGLEIALQMANKIVEIFQGQKKLYIYGCDHYQHIARDLTQGFHSGLMINRPPLPVEFIEHLNEQEPFLTSLGQQGKKGDGILIISGEYTQLAENLLKEAKAKNLFTLAFCGYPQLSNHQPELLFYLPIPNRPRLKEAFLMLGHIICTLVESTLYGNSF
ncbi:MAG TPA: hypothetical protein DEB05_03720 [Firmicutes bacterium]|jgi:hypothetical protein|nr:hypothetical protein [Bacillota bacterium]HBT16047.1 hypothetical protein [Bacillota bacterium]